MLYKCLGIVICYRLEEMSFFFIFSKSINDYVGVAVHLSGAETVNSKTCTLSDTVVNDKTSRGPQLMEIT